MSSFFKNMKNEYKDDLVRSLVAFCIGLLSFCLIFRAIKNAILYAKDFIEMDYTVTCVFQN